MRAMVVTEFGPPEVLQLRDMPEPAPGAHDLLVQVNCAAINPIDFKIRRGAFAQGRTFPFVAGYDVSGVVRAVGDKVEGFRAGDEIYALTDFQRSGANAEYMCVDARTAALKPRSVDHAHAAALPLVALTAWQALYERARIEAGETVLIEGGAGGVGHIAIQLAKLRGCRVLTTASRPESIDLCRSLGAEVVINYAQEDVLERVRAETGGHGCPVVFDCVGFEVFDRCTRSVAPYGRMVSVVGTRSTEALRELFVRNATLHFEFVGAATKYGVNLEQQGQTLRQITELVDAGRLRAHVSRVMALEELSEGHRLQESGHVTGKIAVRVS